MLITPGEPATASPAIWREVFSGYAPDGGGLAVKLAAPGIYAWRVLRVSGQSARYTAGPWSSFTVRAPL